MVGHGVALEEMDAEFLVGGSGMALSDILVNVTQEGNCFFNVIYITLYRQLCQAAKNEDTTTKS